MTNLIGTQGRIQGGGYGDYSPPPLYFRTDQQGPPDFAAGQCPINSVPSIRPFVSDAFFTESILYFFSESLAQVMAQVTDMH